MIAYTTIATDDESYSLSAIIVNNEYKMPSLSIKVDGKEVEYWDAEEYLINTLYPYLQTGVGSDGLDDIFSEVREDVLSLFETGISLGFFKSIQQK
jgi:hypothetical protein